MKRLFLFFFVSLLFSSLNYCMTWEIGLRVVDASGYPINKRVYLYKNQGFYSELYRSGQFKDFAA